MIIPEISQIGGRGANAGRWASAARSSRRPATVSAPAPAEPADVNGDIYADDARDADHISDAPPPGMTLAGVQAAYESS
jgi:hypothetical protein